MLRRSLAILVSARIFVFIVPWLAVLAAGAAPPDALPDAGDDAARAALLQQRREKLKHKWEERFRAADRNQDRKLSREEARDAGLPGSIIERWDEIDTDHDGLLSPEELLDASQQRVREQQTPP